MPRTIDGWPDIVFASDWRNATLTAAANDGRLRRIGHGIYTPSPDADVVVVRRNWMSVLGHSLPGAVVVDASARSGAPDSNGRLFVDHARRSPYVLPGLSIIPRRGPGPLPGDIRLDEFYLSSPARGMLDNLARSDSRRLASSDVERWVVDIVTQHGEERLNAIRDEARGLAQMMDRQGAYERLSAIISAALSSGPATREMSDVLKASARGESYDARRVDLLEACVLRLSQRSPMPLADDESLRQRRRFLPFYEAYFSNYIEGTEFTVDEAARIVFGGEVPADRPEDAHDVLGTYRLVSDRDEMRRVPRSADELLDLLVVRHRTIMELRPDKSPGCFKTIANRAGATVFVSPHHVEGTLRIGYELANRLTDAFARAAYMMFLVSEIHPFLDGNGRVARVMMNAELVAAHQLPIIIPTVFRGEYLGALKNATNNGNFDALVAVLDFAHRYTAQVDFTSRATADRDLARTNAFIESTVAETNNVRLQLPSTLDRLGA
jgi:fido (protein-threonine AMPylation protein)